MMDIIEYNRIMARPVFGDGKCWAVKRARAPPAQEPRYMGMLTKEVELVGRAYDPDPRYTFENGVLEGLDYDFTVVPCASSNKPNTNTRGGKRRSIRKTRRSRKSRSTRSVRK